MKEPPSFGFTEPAPRIDFEEELEQRLLAVREAQTIRIDEPPEERNKRIEIANYAL